MRLDQINSAVIRQAATKEVSRQLGIGNGPTVKPWVKWFRVSKIIHKIEEREVIVHLRSGTVELGKGVREEIINPGWEWFDTKERAQMYVYTTLKHKGREAARQMIDFLLTLSVSERERMRLIYKSEKE